MRALRRSWCNELVRFQCAFFAFLLLLSLWFYYYSSLLPRGKTRLHGWIIFSVYDVFRSPSLYYSRSCLVFSVSTSFRWYILCLLWRYIFLWIAFVRSHVLHATSFSALRIRCLFLCIENCAVDLCALAHTHSRRWQSVSAAHSDTRTHRHHITDLNVRYSKSFACAFVLLRTQWKIDFFFVFQKEIFKWNAMHGLMGKSQKGETKTQLRSAHLWDCIFVRNETNKSL